MVRRFGHRSTVVGLRNQSVSNKIYEPWGNEIDEASISVSIGLLSIGLLSTVERSCRSKRYGCLLLQVAGGAGH